MIGHHDLSSTEHHSTYLYPRETDSLLFQPKNQMVAKFHTVNPATPTVVSVPKHTSLVPTLESCLGDQRKNEEELTAWMLLWAHWEIPKEFELNILEMSSDLAPPVSLLRTHNTNGSSLPFTSVSRCQSKTSCPPTPGCYTNGTVDMIWGSPRQVLGPNCPPPTHTHYGRAEDSVLNRRTLIG